MCIIHTRTCTYTSAHEKRKTGKTERGKASADFSKKTSIPGIELDARTHLYRRYPSPFSRSLSLFFFPPFLLAFPLVIERERGNIPLLPVRNTFPPHELPINPSWNKPINRKRRNALYPFPAKEREGECPSSILDFGSSNRRND